MSRRVIDPNQIEKLSDEMVAVLQAMTPAQRLAMAFECNRTMRLRLQAHLRTYHSDWTDEQITAEVARRMLHGTS